MGLLPIKPAEVPLSYTGPDNAATVVTLGEPDVPRERALQPEGPKEVRDQSDVTKLREAHSIGSDAEISRSSGIVTQTHF